MKGASHSIEINASPEEVYEVLVDFEAYPGFVPNQTGARVLSREGDVWRVRFELSVVKKLAYTLELRGTPSLSLRWTLIEGDMMKANEGGWLLLALPDGRTRATYDIAVELKGFIPSSVTNSLVSTTLPANLKAFKDEAERRT